VAGGAGALAVGLVLTGCGVVGRTGTGNTPVSGGTVTYALPANADINYIFPFAPGTYFTIVNTDNLQYLLYRPLYWWGDKGQPTLNENLSLAYLPSYKGHVVTIRLKQQYKWSNGESLTADDVVFWMNMMKAEAHTNWGGYVPGDFPDNVASVRKVGTSEVQLVISGKFSPTWFTDNELSQITPLPLAWDVTGPHQASDCVHRVSDCTAVFNYLNSIATNPSNWSSSPIWSVVDGPWRLASVSQGALTFAWNSRYTGPAAAHHIAVFKELPFTSEQAEFNVLQAGGNNALDVGYLPTVDAPVPPPGSSAGQNPVAGYQLHAVYTWGLSYFPYNFNPANPQVAIFRQLYFRRAFQLLVNQAAIIEGPLHGYGRVSTGPVGDSPRTSYLSPTALQGDPFPYNLGESRSLLAAHGWNVNPGGVTTCQNPGIGPSQCGSGIRAGAQLSFTLRYATGQSWVEAGVLQLKSNASQVGINIKLIADTFDGVLSYIEGSCGSAAKPKPCPWQLADWGQGWSYVPDYLPTGDELFQTGSAGNLGAYSDHKDDQLIAQTVQNFSLRAMYRWEDYLAKQLPVVMQPEAPAALVENIDNLYIGPQDPTLDVTPEFWHFLR